MQDPPELEIVLQPGRCYRCRVRLCPPSPAAAGQRRPPAAGRSGPRAALGAPCLGRHRRAARAAPPAPCKSRTARRSSRGTSPSRSGPSTRCLALALVGPGDPHIHNPALVMIVDEADVSAGRQLDHHRPGREIKCARTVWRIGVERESDLTGGGGAIADLLVIGEADLAVAVKDPLHRHRRVPEPVRGHRALQISLVAQPDRRVVQRKAALQRRIRSFASCSPPRSVARSGRTKSLPHQGDHHPGA